MAMRRAAIALAIAIVITGATTLAYLWLEPRLSPMFAFWPGFIAQWALEHLGISTTNRILLWVTALFWWPVAWAALTGVTRVQPNPPVNAGARAGAAPCVGSGRAGYRQR